MAKVATMEEFEKWHIADNAVGVVDVHARYLFEVAVRLAEKFPGVVFVWWTPSPEGVYSVSAVLQSRRPFSPSREVAIVDAGEEIAADVAREFPDGVDRKPVGIGWITMSKEKKMEGGELSLATARGSFERSGCGAAVLLLSVAAACVAFGCDDKKQAAPVATQPPPAPPVIAPPTSRATVPASKWSAPPVPKPTTRALAEVRLHHEEVIDTPLKVQLNQHFIAAGLSKEDLRAVLLAKLEEVRWRTGFEHAKYPTHYQIAIYTSWDLAAKEGYEWVGMLTKIRTNEPTVTIK